MFDFDDYLSKAMAFTNQVARLDNRKNSANAAMYTGKRSTFLDMAHSNDRKLAGVRPIEPIHCIETPHCQALAWHPTDHNKIVAGFLNNQPGNSVHVYDLNDFPQDPLVRLKAERQAAFTEVNDVLCFSASGHGGGAPNVAAAGGREKVVRVWDVRQPQSRPTFVFGPRATGRKPDVKALCYWPEKSLLFYGDSGGGITAHDMRKLAVQAFSTKKLPKWRSTINVANKGIVSLVCDPSGSGQLAYRMQNGSVGLVECNVHNQFEMNKIATVVPEPRTNVETASSSNGSAPLAGTRHEHASVAASTPAVSTAEREAAAAAERRRLKMMPTRTIRYLSGQRDPILCVGAWNMSCVQFVPVNTRALARQRRAVAGPSKYCERAPKPHPHAMGRLKSQCFVELENNGKKSGGGVTALACHRSSGSVVACLDDGRTVVACARGRL